MPAADTTMNMTVLRKLNEQGQVNDEEQNTLTEMLNSGLDEYVAAAVSPNSFSFFFFQHLEHYYATIHPGAYYWRACGRGTRSRWDTASLVCLLLACLQSLFVCLFVYFSALANIKGRSGGNIETTDPPAAPNGDSPTALVAAAAEPAAEEVQSPADFGSSGHSTTRTEEEENDEEGNPVWMSDGSLPRVDQVDSRIKSLAETGNWHAWWKLFKQVQTPNIIYLQPT